MRRIFWDTMLHIYWLEGHAKHGNRIGHIYDTMQRRNDILCSSPIVLSEILVAPTKMQDIAAISAIESHFRSPAISMLSFPLEAARIFADLRANQGIKSVDALHLATAAHAGVDLFLSNDNRLRSVSIPGIKFIASMDTDLF